MYVRIHMYVCTGNVTKSRCGERETSGGPLRGRRWRGGKVGEDEVGDIDEEAETEERGIGQ